MDYRVRSWIMRSATATVLLYARLRERGIPFLIYSGFDGVGGASAGAPHISKPAAPGELVAAMEKLISAAVPS